MSNTAQTIAPDLPRLCGTDVRSPGQAGQQTPFWSVAVAALVFLPIILLALESDDVLPKMSVILHGSLLALAIGLVPLLYRLSRGVAFLVGGLFAWCALVAFSGLASGMDAADAVQTLRFAAMVPAALVIAGFAVGRLAPAVMPWGLLCCGAVNLVLMILSISYTGPKDIYGGLHIGQEYRAYVHFIQGEIVSATSAVLNCSGLFLAVAFVQKSGGWLLRALQIAGFFCGIWFSVHTGTRGGMLCFSFVIFGSLGLHFLQTRKMLSLGLPILLGALVIGTVSVVISRSSDASLDKRFALESLLDTSLSARTAIWSERLDLIAAFPEGAGYRTGLKLQGMSSHNLFLDMIYILGVLPGTVLVLALLGVGLHCLWTLLRTTVDPPARAYATAVSSLLAVNMIESSVTSSYQCFALLCLCVGGYLGRRLRHERSSGSKAKANREIALATR